MSLLTKYVCVSTCVVARVVVRAAAIHPIRLLGEVRGRLGLQQRAAGASAQPAVGGVPVSPGDHHLRHPNQHPTGRRTRVLASCGATPVVVHAPAFDAFNQQLARELAS